MENPAGSTGDALVAVTSLEEFFRDSVEAALASNHVAVEHDTAHYVVSLLTVSARADACHDPGAGRARHRPLALMLAEAVAADTLDDRLFGLQRLGDMSLVTAGFFADGLRDRPIGLDYYVNMGGGAYRLLATSGARRRVRALAAVFAELGAKFADLVDVLHEVRESARGAAEADVLRLYEIWLQTGSRRAARRLRQAGIEPLVAGSGEHRH